MSIFEEYGAFDILDKYGKRLCSNDTPKGFCRHFVKGELLAEWQEIISMVFETIRF